MSPGCSKVGSKMSKNVSESKVSGGSRIPFPIGEGRTFYTTGRVLKFWAQFLSSRKSKNRNSKCSFALVWDETSPQLHFHHLSNKRYHFNLSYFINLLCRFTFHVVNFLRDSNEVKSLWPRRRRFHRTNQSFPSWGTFGRRPARAKTGGKEIVLCKCLHSTVGVWHRFKTRPAVLTHRSRELLVRRRSLRHYHLNQLSDRWETARQMWPEVRLFC